MIVVPPDNYQLNASAKTITLTAPFATIGIEQILSIRNISKNQLLYDSEDPKKHTISLTNGVIGFSGEPTTGDKIQIKVEYDNQNFAGIEFASIDGGTP